MDAKQIRLNFLAVEKALVIHNKAAKEKKKQEERLKLNINSFLKAFESQSTKK